MARTRKIETPKLPEACWIKYQMDLRGITMDAVAIKAGCHPATVSRAINGKRDSKITREVLAEMLGFKSFLHLWRAASIASGRMSA
jgi:transcriptional regulator with XRE-family HTH domain